uniref:Uncharacterized protein n=1 Tax=Schistosoma mansoni TaxID=6183 RepID=A0A913KUR2_SCHMA
MKSEYLFSIYAKYWALSRGNVIPRSIETIFGWWKLAKAKSESVRPLVISEVAAFIVVDFVNPSLQNRLIIQDVLNMRHRVCSQTNFQETNMYICMNGMRVIVKSGDKNFLFDGILH